jgi:hypothetical protein
MNWKIKAGVAVVVAGAVVGGAVVTLGKRSQPAVSVTLRVAVTPAGQVDYVTGRANSAQFKYLLGKQSGVKPVLAQKLVLKPVPHSSLVEARVSGLTKEEGHRYVEAFVPTLQDLCGRQAQVTLAEQSVR